MRSVYPGGPSDIDYKDDDDHHEEGLVGLVDVDVDDDDPHEEGLPRWPHPRGCCDRVSLIALDTVLSTQMHSALCCDADTSLLHCRVAIDKVLVGYRRSFYF